MRRTLNVPFEQLLQKHKNIIEKAVNRSKGYTNLQREDLRQEARMALYRAQQTWKADGKRSFQNYAYLLMQRFIYNAIRAYNKQHKVNGKREIYPRDIPFSDMEGE